MKWLQGLPRAGDPPSSLWVGNGEAIVPRPRAKRFFCVPLPGFKGSTVHSVSPRWATSGSLGAPVGAQPCAPWWWGVTYAPNQHPRHPPPPQLLSERKPEWSCSKIAPFRPSPKPGRAEGVSRTPQFHPPPRLQGPSPTLRELPHPSSPGGRAPESSFPGARRELGLFCSHHFLINSLFLRDEWTRAVLCLVLARPRDAAAQRRYLLGPFQGLCHAAWSLGIFARLPPQIGPENLAMPSLENKRGNRGAGGVWAKPG